MIDLAQRSIEIILQNQSSSGAYIASPSFPTYKYCWFRDGSYIAYAMDLCGQTESAKQFHSWAANVILQRAELIHKAVRQTPPGSPPDAKIQLHTRYTLDGKEVSLQEWPNYQLDGLGTWLWALNEHCRLNQQSIPEDWLAAANLVGLYLQSFWQTPCFDCWEEYPNVIHTHTLAAIYGGLKALSDMDFNNHSATLAALLDYLSHHSARDGYFVKMTGSYTVDASLLGLVLPYNVVAGNDPRFTATLERIETSLVTDGGVHRYPTDVYYGGGEWVLLAGWLGWVQANLGNIGRAVQLLHWIEGQADEEGNLPEQIPNGLRDPNYYQPWLNHWGPIARPLLWSHAMHLILIKNLNNQSHLHN